MNAIRSRLLLLSALCLSLIVGLGFVGFTSFRQYIGLQAHLAESYELVDVAIALNRKTIDPEEFDEWQKRIAGSPELIQPSFRFEAFKNVFKNPSHENLSFLLKTENEYRKYLAPLISYFEQRVHFFGALLVVASILFTFGVLIYVLQYLFAPLRELSRKMIEFLNNRYTYEFSTPQPTEIGELQATFNTLAQKVLSQIEDLKSLDRAKSEFLSIASHELRTPLTSIKGSLGLLNSGIMGAVTDKAGQLMSIALDETDRLIRLINEILDLAKIEAKQFPLNMEWTWAQDFTEKTFQGLRGFCQGTEVMLAVDDCADLDLYVDRDRLQQVLTNLVSNAVKYSPRGETVRVRYIIDDKQAIRVEVTDKGRGIAPEDQEIIFEKFRQAASPQNPLVKGTGLGLAIAKALVEQHGGTIGVHSLPGEGSTFYFTLPKWRQHRERERSVS